MGALSAGFDEIAEQYDDIFTNSVIGRAQRKAVWRQLERVLAPGQRMLELNCGTGVDALWIAQHGISVDACDISPRMIAIASRQHYEQNPSLKIRFFVLPIEELDRVDGRYDGVMSNFGGLNCVRDLPAVARELGRLVRPGGFLLINLAGRFCAWELAWYAAHGEFRKSVRRLAGEAGARLGRSAFPVYYPTIRQLTRMLAPGFQLRRRRGIGIMVPPTYVESWAARHPSLITAAAILDQTLSRLPLVRAAADHVLLVLERTRA